jgi:hypothetical protein
MGVEDNFSLGKKSGVLGPETTEHAARLQIKSELITLLIYSPDENSIEAPSQ